MEIDKQILSLIISRKEGILQSEVWKITNIDRRKCSKIIDKLEKEGKITRQPQLNKGSRTYLIRYIGKKEKTQLDFGLLLVGDVFSPCTGCISECVPWQCSLLSAWVYGLIK